MPAQTSQTYFVEPLSPLVLRSGRPFGQVGQTGAAQGALWPLPGTMAGTLRAAWCDATGLEPGDADSRIDRLHLHGPLPMTWGANTSTLWLVPPANARVAVGNNQTNAIALWPRRAVEGAGCDLPCDLLPVLPPETVFGALRDPAPQLWSLEAVSSWLLGGSAAAQPNDADEHCLALPISQDQVHIAMDGSRQVKVSAFYVNQAVDHGLRPESARRHGRRGLWVRAEVPPLTDKQRGKTGQFPDQEELLKQFAGIDHQPWRLGADGASAHVEPLPQHTSSLYRPLQALNSSLLNLQTGDHICLMLATPGCFGPNGWFPWLTQDHHQRTDQPLRNQRLATDKAPEGRLPGWPPGWLFRLRAAQVGALVPQGSYKARTGRKVRGSGSRGAAHQPRLGRLQWLAPAGSLYWFEVLAAGKQPADPAALQLRPCTHMQYARDGHALALYAKASLTYAK